MQSLLNDIELDIQELKCLMQAIAHDANPALRIVAKRNIMQMRVRLDELQSSLDEPAVVVLEQQKVHELSEMDEHPKVQEQSVEQEQPTIPQETLAALGTSTILAERIKPVTDLRRAISLNDSFRFTRELFNGNAARMNEVVRKLDEASDLEKAIAIFVTEVQPEEENVAATDFIELLKKYFS